MNLRARILLLATGGAALLALLSVAVGFRFEVARDAGRQLNGQLQPASDVADQLFRDLAVMDRSVRSFAVGRDPVDTVAYSTAAAQSGADLDTLRQLLTGQPESLLAQLESARETRDIWVSQVAEPALSATRAGHSRAALELLLSAESAAKLSAAEQSTIQLEDSIGEEKIREFDLLSQLVGQLALALVTSVFLLLGGLFLAMALVRLWVLQPLAELRNQLRSVTNERKHETPIRPSGPPELEAVGQDAERMRRELVSQIDEARAAREGLAQEGPVVTAIRAELAGPIRVNSPTAEVYGELHPADGVLAGDWWDACQLDRDRIAIAVADISGHGPAAGIAGLRLKTAVMTSLRQGGPAGVDFPGLAAMLGEDDARCATCVIVVLDRADQRITWANAGHLPPLILGPERSVLLRATGPLLSTLGGRWRWESARFDAADLLLVGTDGLTESHDRNGTELDERGLRLLATRLVASGPESPAELVPSLVTAVRHRSADWRRDDATLVAARLLPRADPSAGGRL